MHAQRFDDALSGLLAKKLKAKADITALESRCVALAVNVDRCESASDRLVGRGGACTALQSGLYRLSLHAASSCGCA